MKNKKLDKMARDDLFKSAASNIQPIDAVASNKKKKGLHSFATTDNVPSEPEAISLPVPVFPAASLFPSVQHQSQSKSQELPTTHDDSVIESGLSPLQKEKIRCEDIYFNFALLSKEEQILMKKIARELCIANEESISLAKVLQFYPSNPSSQLCFQPIEGIVNRFKQKICPADDEQSLEQFLQAHPMLKVEEYYFAPKREKLVNLYFHLALLTDMERKLLIKAVSELKLHRGTDISVAHILYDWKPQWSRSTVCGIPVMDAFNPFKDKINRELNQVLDVIEYNVYDFLTKNSIFRLHQDVELSIEQVDTILNKDLMLFLASLDDTKKMIISRNFGLDGHEAEPFGDIAPDFEMTRSRAHQTAVTALKVLQRSLSITPSTMWNTMKITFNKNIKQYYPKLGGRFSRELEFLSFLEMLMKMPKGKLDSIIYPDLNLKLLEDWFLSHLAPMPVATAVGLLSEKYRVSEQHVINAMDLEVSQDRFMFDGQMITPKKLGKMESVVQAILAFPRGANFRQIYERVNQQGFSDYTLVDESIEHGITNAVEAGWIYLSRRNVYKHINYFPLDQKKIKMVLETIHHYLVRHPNRMNGVNLKSDVYKQILDLQQIDYFDVRHVVRIYGHKKGINFYSQPRKDMLRLKAKQYIK